MNFSVAESYLKRYRGEAPWRDTYSSLAASSFARQRSGRSCTRCPVASPGLQGPAPQARSLSEPRSRHDVAPPRHGEVFVTDDGAETDLDLGHYERFTGPPATKTDNITTGRVSTGYHRQGARGDYLGATVRWSATSPTPSRTSSTATTTTTSCLSKSAAPLATSRACPSSRRSASLKNDLPRGHVHLHSSDAVPYIPARRSS